MDIQKEREIFETWVDSEFNDCSWYEESQKLGNMHAYRIDQDDYWQYEETLLWYSWQAAQKVAVPDSHVVVPKEPTGEILKAMKKADDSSLYTTKIYRCGLQYKAMIEAQENQ